MLNLQIVEDIREFALLEAEWCTLAENDCRAWAFQHHTWLSAMLEFEDFTTTRLCVVCLRSEGRLVGAAPFVLTAEFGRLGYRVLRFLGQNLTDFNDILIHSEISADVVFGGLSKWIASERDQIDRIELQNVPRNSNLHEHLSLLKLDLSFDRLEISEMEECQYIALPDSYDAYVAGLKKSRRHDLKRRRRRTLEAFPTEISHKTSAAAGQPFFDALVQLHQKRQESNYQRGLFRDEHRKRVMQSLFSRLLDKGLMVLHVLTLEDNVALVKISLDFQNKRMLYNGGIDYRPEYSKFGIGKWFSLCQIEDAINRGFSEINFGRGGESHKSDYSTTERTNFEIVAEESSMKGALYAFRDKTQQFVYNSEPARKAAFHVYRLSRQMSKTK